MKGQISAEMLIILAVVVVIALLVASQMVSMAQETSEQVEETNKDIIGNLSNVSDSVTWNN